MPWQPCIIHPTASPHHSSRRWLPPVNAPACSQVVQACRRAPGAAHLHAGGADLSIRVLVQNHSHGTLQVRLHLHQQQRVLRNGRGHSRGSVGGRGKAGSGHADSHSERRTQAAPLCRHCQNQHAPNTLSALRPPFRPAHPASQPATPTPSHLLHKLLDLGAVVVVCHGALRGVELKEVEGALVKVVLQFIKVWGHVRPWRRSAQRGCMLRHRRTHCLHVKQLGPLRSTAAALAAREQQKQRE